MSHDDVAMARKLESYFESTGITLLVRFFGPQQTVLLEKPH